MTLTTLGGIKTAIDDFLSRQGDFTDAYKSEYFVTLAHARIHHGSTDPRFPSEPIRIRAMESSTIIPTTFQEMPLPDRYLAMRRIHLDTQPYRVLQFLPPMDFWLKFGASGQTGMPQAYTLEGENNIIFGPAPDSEYTAKILCWLAFPLPDDDSDTNWLMTNVPGAYLYGALLEAACVIQDDEQIARYGPMFAGAIGGLIASDKRDRFSGAPLMMRSDSGTP